MASSAMALAMSLSPKPTKRLREEEAYVSKPFSAKPGPFVYNDDSSDEELDESQSPPQPKKQMLQHDSECQDQNSSSIGELEPQPIYPLEEATLPASLTTFTSSTLDLLRPASFQMRTCEGNACQIKQRKGTAAASYESMVAARSRTKDGRARKSYYGIDIHELIKAAKDSEIDRAADSTNTACPSAETSDVPTRGAKRSKSLLWTEKYRARKFMDLCGDDGTNRLVLRWLKRWDGTVFPGMQKPTINKRNRASDEEEKPHRKILMLTGPPGLGKTTLAHVCARQAGYEVMEINASDDRSRDVVKNRIRTSLGTESVKNVANRKGDDGGQQKIAKPVCVVVDEVDGVVSGSGGAGEGGFVRALIDLVLTDQRNAAGGKPSSGYEQRNKKKGDDFRLMRPLVLICNDVYAPALRPLRQSNLAEIIHVGRPSLDAVVGRLRAVFEKEGIPCDKDASRKLCEAAWGMSSGLDARRGAESTVQGDLRGVMVVGEWVAGRFRAANDSSTARLTRQWIEQNIIHDLHTGAAGARGLGRGSTKDIIGRLFQEGGGFPKQAMNFSRSNTQHEQPKTELGFGEQQKKHAMERLTQMIETSGEVSHIVNDVFAEYPNREYNDDCYLTKPNQAYEWLHFHDACQSRLYTSQEWELAPYLSQPLLACHDLFASPKRHVAAVPYERKWGAAEGADDTPPMPFSGLRADFQAHEAEKAIRSQLQGMQSQLSPTMMRLFRSADDMATDFMPYLVRLVSPDVKPVVVGGSSGTTASVRKNTEKEMVRRAAEVLAETGVSLHKGKIESDVLSSRGPQFVYRMEPDLDALSTFETGASLLSSQVPTRFAVRQVLDQELQRALAHREALSRLARLRGVDPPSSATAATIAPTVVIFSDDKENRKHPELGKAVVKKDFFGRTIQATPLSELDANAERRKKLAEEQKVWVTYHEGLNNAVRKPLSLQEFLSGL